MTGDTGKGANADVADLQPLQLSGLFVDSICRIAQVADIGQHLLTAGCQCHAGLAAIQQCHLQLILQRTNDLTNGGL